MEEPSSKGDTHNMVYQAQNDKKKPRRRRLTIDPSSFQIQAVFSLLLQKKLQD